jgi:catechol 2,3-dioxygenase-like lactoylglutathione lyase family enzyme
MKLKLHSSTFYVSDFEKSLEFFKKLGLKKVYQHEKIYAKLAFDNNHYLSIAKTTGGRDVPGHQTIVVKTSDLEEVYDFCKSESFNFIWQLCEKPWGKTFIITDPDGNWIEFQEE